MSFVLLKNGRSRTILAMDSRASYDVGYADTSEKLFAVGPRMLCGIVGTEGVGPSEPVAEIIVRLSEDRSLQDSPRAFLNALRSEVYPRFVASLQTDPEEFKRGRAANLVFGAICAKRSASGLDLVNLEIEMDRGELRVPEIKTVATGVSVPFAYTMGQEVGAYNPLNFVDPSASDADLIAGVTKTFEDFAARDETFRTDCGGALEIAVIEDRVRWLQHDASKREIRRASLMPQVATAKRLPFPFGWWMRAALPAKAAVLIAVFFAALVVQSLFK